jgi:small subunit ribosomal protein S6
MNNYELTVILGEKITPAKKKAFVAGIEKLLKALAGKVVKVDDWGKRDFAYKINKLSTGNYLFVKLLLEKGAIKSLKEKLRMEEGVIRYLLVRNGKK